MPFDRELLEAQVALELISSADMPKIAWDALEAGLDGPATRRLAALERPTWFQVNEVLPQATREMGLTQMTTADAAVRIARRLASQILTSGEDPLLRGREFERLWIRAGYPRELGSVGNLDDELFIRNSSEPDDRELVISRLKEFLS